jgi:Fe-S cluster biogenesis protein NfuA
LREKVVAVLDSIRASLQADGGDVELVDVIEDQGVVKVKLVGACKGCPMSAMTLQMGIERLMRQQIPEVKRVEAVQDEEE